MNQDLEIIRKILSSMSITDSFIDVLLMHIIKNFEEYKLEEITPNFLYRILALELGKKYAEDVSYYFKQYKETGTFKNKLKDFLDNSPWMK